MACRLGISCFRLGNPLLICPLPLQSSHLYHCHCTSTFRHRCRLPSNVLGVLRASATLSKRAVVLLTLRWLPLDDAQQPLPPNRRSRTPQTTTKMSLAMSMLKVTPNLFMHIPSIGTTPRALRPVQRQGPPHILNLDRPFLTQDQSYKDNNHRHVEV